MSATAALTGVRGLAAMHVALGHMFSFSTLRLDLIGGAASESPAVDELRVVRHHSPGLRSLTHSPLPHAVPFFYLLSGFVMTLGYGQSAYSADGCCCVAPVDGDKSFNKKTFWRNRFARLGPVYFLTNFTFAPMLLANGAQAGMGGTQGIHMALVSMFLALFGLNTWLYPFADVGPPPNGVCWTISTMSFFYWVFPYALPRMQRMSTAKRSEWIVIFYWLQLVTCAPFLPSHLLRKLSRLTAP